MSEEVVIPIEIPENNIKLSDKLFKKIDKIEKENKKLTNY